MADIPITVAQTAAIGSAGPPIVCALADLSAYEFGILSCDLATTEEVDIYARVGGVWREANDVTGTPQKLTASVTHLKLEGGKCYGVRKDVTAAAVSVWLALGPGLNR